MEINDVIMIKHDIPGAALAKGAKGVIVAIFDEPYLAYEIEFCDEDGRQVKVLTLSKDDIEQLDVKY